ncbi:MAG TPA: helix-turn-helix domain-containing protein [Micromonosporaceae bacterium]
MLHRRRLLDSPTVGFMAVRCDGTPAEHPPAHARRWSPEEPVTGPAVVLVRQGVFRLRSNGVASVADVTTGYVQRPGDIHQIAHPAGGDICTSIAVTADLADEIADGGPVDVTPAADLAHRRLLAWAKIATDPTDLCDLTTELLTVLTPVDQQRTPPPGTRAAIDDVRVALAGDLGLSLDDLAAIVGLSPWYLSRTFHRVIGATLSSYRRRLRVRAALNELADTDNQPVSLAALAVAYGFADQAHLTRAVHRETALPPGKLRTSLLPSGLLTSDRN